MTVRVRGFRAGSTVRMRLLHRKAVLARASARVSATGSAKLVLRASPKAVRKLRRGAVLTLRATGRSSDGAQRIVRRKLRIS